MDGMGYVGRVSWVAWRDDTWFRIAWLSGSSDNALSTLSDVISKNVIVLNDQNMIWLAGTKSCSCCSPCESSISSCGRLLTLKKMPPWMITWKVPALLNMSFRPPTLVLHVLAPLRVLVLDAESVLMFSHLPKVRCHDCFHIQFTLDHSIKISDLLWFILRWRIKGWTFKDETQYIGYFH